MSAHLPILSRWGGLWLYDAITIVADIQMRGPDLISCLPPKPNQVRRQPQIDSVAIFLTRCIQSQLAKFTFISRPGSMFWIDRLLGQMEH